MPRFAVLVCADNVIVNEGNLRKSVGCFVTRTVRADTRHAAIAAVIELVRSELESKKDVVNDPKNKPVFAIEEVRQLQFFQRRINSGFVWYDEGNSAEGSAQS